MSPSREAVWERIMAIQEKYNRLEQTFADIPADRIGWWLRWRFKRSVDAMIAVRGAHSHGGVVSESLRRLPGLERAAIAYSARFDRLMEGGGEKS